MKNTKDIDSIINKNMPEQIKALRELIRIPSAISEERPGMPFGEGPAKALDAALELCKGLGFRTKNCDGYIGYAEAGEGDEMIGILTHLDVVPEGSGWKYPPYDAQIHDGCLYGRGAMDNKGPAVAVSYALKALLESGMTPKKRIRIIFGTDEESDWRDIDYYKQHEELPSCGFTPDADFPVIFAEKGILVVELRIPLDKAGILHIDAGVAVNSVPDSCCIRYCDENGETRCLETQGKASHGSLPHQGLNAIAVAMQELYNKSGEGKSYPIAEFWHNAIGMETDGAGLNIKCSDEASGALTCNVGRAFVDNGSELCFLLDLRCPVTCDEAEIFNRLESRAGKYGLSARLTGSKPALHVDKDSTLVKTLMSVYQDITKDQTPPLSMGGGTYARAMDNIVAFGPLLPGRPETEHKNTEHISLDDFNLITRIYAQAILRLNG